MQEVFADGGCAEHTARHGRRVGLDRGAWQARPGLPTALARAKAGQRIDELLYEIAELQRVIDTSSAETLEDAAVKLRRLKCRCGGEQAHTFHLLWWGQSHGLSS